MIENFRKKANNENIYICEVYPGGESKEMFSYATKNDDKLEVVFVSETGWADSLIEQVANAYYKTCIKNSLDVKKKDINFYTVLINKNLHNAVRINQIKLEIDNDDNYFGAKYTNIPEAEAIKKLANMIPQSLLNNLRRYPSESDSRI